MKPKSTVRSSLLFALVHLLSFASIKQLNAQCTETSTLNNLNSHPVGVGQSFIPACSGYLTQFKMQFGTKTTFHPYYPIDAKALLFTGDVSYTATSNLIAEQYYLIDNIVSDAFFTIQLTTPMPVTAGTQYTFWLKPDYSADFPIRFTASNPYPNGKKWSIAASGSVSNSSTQDFYFEAVISPTPPCPSTASVTNLGICSSQLPYLWNGKLFTTASSDTVHLINAAGCDSVATLNLTVNNSASDTTATVCGNFTWHDSTFTTSTNYVWHTTNAAGCDSAVTLHLTIADKSAMPNIYPACAGDTLIVVGTPEADGSRIDFFINGVNVGNGNFSNDLVIFSTAAMTGGDKVQAVCTAAGKCPSDTSAIYVKERSSIPAITDGICAGAKTIDGTSSEPDGTTIQVFVNNAFYNRASVQSGHWSLFGNALSAGDVVRITAMPVGKCFSNALEMTVASPPSSDTTATACSGFTWHGVAYTTSGDKKFTTTSASGCDSIVTLHLTIVSKSVSSSFGKTDAVCYGSATGSISGAATSGMSPFQYKLGSGGSYSAPTNVPYIANNLRAGTYYVYVKDAEGCVARSAPITISQGSLVTAAASATDALCNAAKGGIKVTPTSGVSPYSFKLGTAGQFSLVDSFAVRAGTYQITVKDANGCSTVVKSTVNQPAAITTTPVTQDIICGQTSGSATWSSIGGTPGYKYRLGTTGSFTSTTSANKLRAGIYHLYTMDTNNCSATPVAFTIYSVGCTRDAVTQSRVIVPAGGSFDAAISPNPATHLFKLSIKGKMNEAVSVRVLDVNGKTVYTTKGSASQLYNFGETLVPGMYMVELRQGNEVKTLKAVKVN